ncbi:hypothetical protein H0H81_006756 [Sphagnurus paluster]|uniref:Uncharacterized protein n=1 Tax=Sphagnurus paluster TaxID=117069 RepID=A0A9P7K6H0_9AGAR|nr:hypothetical protein H0H81_006756 [Sphagnurus paluster]
MTVGGIQHIRSIKHPNLQLDFHGLDVVAGTVGHPNQPGSQKWDIKAEHGFYVIQNVLTNKYLTPSGHVSLDDNPTSWALRTEDGKHYMYEVSRAPSYWGSA